MVEKIILIIAGIVLFMILVAGIIADIKNDKPRQVTDCESVYIPPMIKSNGTINLFPIPICNK